MKVIKKENKTLLSIDDEVFFNCLIGKNGITESKTEGDKATPVGSFGIKEIYYRKDKIGELDTVFKTTVIEENFGWCDDPNSPEYNKFIILPHEGSFENLWRKDDSYDLVLVLDYNLKPVLAGKGSAIFMHTTRPDMRYTDGCVALNKDDLLKVLSLIKKDSKVTIRPF